MRYTTFCVVGLLLVACQSKPMGYLVAPDSKEIVGAARPGETVTGKGAIYCGSNPAQANDSLSEGSIREAETVKAYGMNRYLDPNDPRMMHERHAIYRLEQQPAWVTRSPRNQNEVLLGPVVGLRKPEYAPEPLPGETARDLVTTKHRTEQAAEDIKVVREGQEKLVNSVQSLAKQTVEAQQKLTTVVSVLNDRVKRLEGENNEGSQTSSNVAGENNVVVRGPGQ